MAEKCLCDSGLKSLHTKRKCKDYLRKVNHALPIMRANKDGVANSIDISTVPIPESVFAGMFNAADPLARLHAIYDVKNTAFEPQDGTTEDYSDGTSTKLQDGHLQFTFLVPETNIGFIGNSKSLECQNPDMFLYLADGSIVGYADRDKINDEQKVRPLPVDRIEVSETPISTDDAVAKIEVTVHFSKDMDYGMWIIIAPGEHEFDVTKNYEPAGAKMVKGTTPTTTTSIEVVVSQEGFGIMGNSVPHTGLVAADFELTSNGTPVTPLTPVESPAGTYLISFTAQTSGDEIKVSLAPTSGYVAPVVTDLVP